MLARKCDRCGKHYDHYDGGKKYKPNAIRLIERDVKNNNSTEVESRDLCPGCMVSLEAWLEDGKVRGVGEDG